jgi:zona occludens toxin (predicted ATPase)
MKKEKKIPTILGLLFLVISVIAGVYLSSGKVTFRSKASGDCKPVNVQATNITHNSFAISFVTSAECISSLSIDDLVIMNFIQSSKIHYFPVDNLQESTEYHYSIVSGGETYDEASFIIQTAKKPNGVAPVSDIAWGKVYNSDNTVGS